MKVVAVRATGTRRLMDFVGYGIARRNADERCDECRSTLHG